MSSIDALIDALRRNPDLVIPLIRQADPAVIKRRPPSGKWSIHEHACHLAVADQLFLTRMDLMLSQDCPTIRSFDPGRDEPPGALLHVDLEESLLRYRTLREELIRKAGELTEKDWWKTAEHDEYNSYSMFTMLRHLALHDFFHAYRIEELLLRRDWPKPLPQRRPEDGHDVS